MEKPWMKYFAGARFNMSDGQSHVQIHDQLLNAVMLHREGRVAEAAELYRATLCQAPDNADALHLLGVILWQNEGRIADALVLISRGITVAPHSPLISHSINSVMDAAKAAAIRNHNDGLKEEAEALYKAILLHEPENINILSLLAQLYHGSDAETLEKRIKTYRRLIIRQPDQRQHWIDLGYALEQAGRPDEACAAYVTGTGHPVGGYAYCIATASGLFNVKYDIDAARQQFPHIKLNRVIQLLQRALELNPHSSEARLTLARAHRIRHQADQALAEIDAVLSLNPSSFEANTLRGHMLYRKGRLGEALVHYQAAMDVAQEATKSFQIVRRDLAHIEKIKSALPTPPAPDSQSIPIIFIHFGYNDYLMYATASARLSNPGKDIILIGDDSNEFVSQYGVRHFHINKFNNGENMKKFRGVCKFIHGALTVHDKTWNQFCFERWFILQEFVKNYGYKKFWIFDSDTMIFEDLSTSESDLIEYDFTEQSSGRNIGGLINSDIVFDDYIDFINNEYDSIAKFQEIASSDGMAKKIVGIGAMDDMAVYWYYKDRKNINSKNLGDVINGRTFNDLIWKSDPPDEWERDGKGIRTLYIENGHFYHALKQDGTKILINAINLSFVPLNTMEKYFDILRGRLEVLHSAT